MIPPTYSPQDAASPDPVYTYRMAVSPGRVRGSASPFREGSLALTAAGFQVDGKSILPTGRRVAILIVSAVFMGAIVASLLLEYVFRVRRSLSVRWEEVEEVVLVSREQKVCLVYRCPEQPDRVDSLAFRMDTMSFSHFVQVANYFVPGRVREGKIGGPTSPRELVITLVVVVLMIVGVAVLITLTSHR